MSVRGTGGKLIKRFHLPSVNRKVVSANDGWDNSIGEYSSQNFISEYCTLHPTKQEDLSIDLEGVTLDKVFTLITDTPLISATQGTDQLGCSIYISSCFFNFNSSVLEFIGLDGWYRVVSPKNSFNGVIPHCEALLVRDSTLVDDNGIVKYPILTEQQEAFFSDKDNFYNLRGLEDVWL